MTGSPTFNITPDVREYILTHPNPEVITNLLYFLTKRLKDVNAEKHTHIMFEYPLDFVSPSSRFMGLINKILELRGIHWRLRNIHVIVKPQVVRVIARKTSLIDLTTPEANHYEPDLHLERVLRAFCKQYDTTLLAGPSNMAVFRLPSGKFYWVYTRIFDMWEYNDEYPEQGWKEILMDGDTPAVVEKIHDAESKVIVSRPIDLTPDELTALNEQEQA